MAARLKLLVELAGLREELAARAASREREARTVVARIRRERRAGDEFRAAVADVTPLPPHGRHRVPGPRRPADPVSRLRDDEDVLHASVSDEIDVESLLDTDEALSYRAGGIGPDVLRRLRRGHWTIQAHVDLHGHRVEEARHSLGLFLRRCLRHGLRCVRVVHGKGLGSKDRVPVLKGKVRAWLVQRAEVIAFCQARPADGGSGALIVLLRPSTPTAGGAGDAGL
jgi:DNA-nicking Smr family endonuclease